MKNPLALFFPYAYIDSVFAIDYNKLFNKGFRAVIFDIDMTLVPHGFKITSEIENLFKTIHSAGLKTFLLTNNDEKRAKDFSKNINTLYISDAHKPATKNYLKAVEMLNLKPNEVVYVGDQIFVDIFGANRSGLANILVKYVTATVEKNIGIRRNLEKVVLKIYALSKSYHHRLGDIYKNGGSVINVLE